MAAVDGLFVAEFEMNIEIIEATKSWEPAMASMFGFYVYDMSEFMDGVDGWAFPDSGRLEPDKYFDDYWRDEKRWPFIVKVDSELAGFVLVNTTGAFPETDYNIAEFFVHRKKRRQGVGAAVAKDIFERFRGNWEVARMPRNTAAIGFWDRVVAEYTGGQLSNIEHRFPDPEPHTMLILRFNNG